MKTNRSNAVLSLAALFGFGAALASPRLRAFYQRVPPLRLTRSADEQAQRIAAAHAKRARRQLRNLAELRSRQA
jgi:hypothetical protein